MLDLLRDFRKSDEEKRQEALSAYLDDALSPVEKERFEQLLASDAALRNSLEEQRLIRGSLRRLPRLQAPRNFTLDPALYGRPSTSTADRIYPVLRTATALVAILFVVVLVLNFLPFGSTAEEAVQPLAFSTELQRQATEESAAADVAAAATVPAQMAPEAEQDLVGEAAVIITQEVEVAVEEAPMAVEAPVEEAAEEEMVAEAEPPSADEAMAGGAQAEEEPLAGEEFATEAPAEPEGERATGALPSAQATVDIGEAAVSITETPLALEGMAAADATPAGQPTATLAPRDVGPEMDGEVADAHDDAEAPIAEERADLSTNQVLLIGLGICLVILVAVTLLLRRQSRRLP